MNKSMPRRDYIQVRLSDVGIEAYAALESEIEAVIGVTPNQKTVVEAGLIRTTRNGWNPDELLVEETARRLFMEAVARGEYDYLRPAPKELPSWTALDSSIKQPYVTAARLGIAPE